MRLLLERSLQLGVLRQIKSSGTLMLNAQFNKETTGLHLSSLCAMRSPRIGFVPQELKGKVDLKTSWSEMKEPKKMT